MKKTQLIIFLLVCMGCSASLIADSPLDLLPPSKDNSKLFELIDRNMAGLNKISPEVSLGFIHVAAIREETDVLEYLLLKGADPNLLTFLGATGLHHAAQIGNIDGVKLLLEYGADPQLTTYESMPVPFESAFISYHKTRPHNESMRIKILTAMQILLPLTDLSPKRFKHRYLNTAGTDRSGYIPETAEEWLELELKAMGLQ